MAKKAITKNKKLKTKSSVKKKGLTKRDVLKKGKQLSNWGKWGRNDELGVLNYITPQDIVEASKLIEKGKVYTLGKKINLL